MLFFHVTVIIYSYTPLFGYEITIMQHFLRLLIAYVIFLGKNKIYNLSIEQMQLKYIHVWNQTCCDVICFLLKKFKIII